MAGGNIAQAEAFTVDRYEFVPDDRPADVRGEAFVETKDTQGEKVRRWKQRRQTEFADVLQAAVETLGDVLERSGRNKCKSRNLNHRWEPVGKVAV